MGVVNITKQRGCLSFLLMSLACFILLSSQVQAYTKNTSFSLEFLDDGTLTLDAEGVPLRNLLGKIQGKTNLEFEIQKSLLGQPISVRFKSLPLEEAIKRILRGVSYACVFNSSGNVEKIVTFTNNSGVRGGSFPRDTQRIAPPHEETMGITSPPDRNYIKETRGIRSPHERNYIERTMGIASLPENEDTEEVEETTDSPTNETTEEYIGITSLPVTEDTKKTKETTPSSRQPTTEEGMGILPPPDLDLRDSMGIESRPEIEDIEESMGIESQSVNEGIEAVMEIESPPEEDIGEAMEIPVRLR